MVSDHAAAAKGGSKALKLFWEKFQMSRNSFLGLYGDRAISIAQIRNKIRALKQEYRKVFHQLNDTGNDTQNGPMLDDSGCLVVLKDGAKDEKASWPYWPLMNDAFQV
jgi:hypothetical protein